MAVMIGMYLNRFAQRLAAFRSKPCMPATRVGVATGQHQVSIIDSLITGKRQQVNPAARFHEIDLRDADAVRRAVEADQPEIIVHLAAQMDVRRSVKVGNV